MYVNHIDINDNIISKLQFLIEQIVLLKKKKNQLFPISKADV